MADCGYWPLPAASPHRTFSSERQRSEREIAAAYERIRRDLERPDTAGLSPALASDYMVVRQAVAAALSWVLGLTADAPVSGRAMPNPAPLHIWSEYAATLDVRDDLREVPPGLSRHFVSAVELALDWVQGHAEAPLTA